jgi:hypothetical protein
VSDFKFIDYIIFLGGVPDTFREDDTITVFNIDNIKEKALKSLKAGLLEECKAKEYVSPSDISEDKIAEFIKCVWFVIDDKEPNVVYVIGYIYYNQDLFEEALVDSKNFNYVKGE